MIGYTSCLLVENKIMLINFTYIPRDTPVHRLDPRVKFLLLFIYSLIVVQTSNFWVIGAGLLFATYYYSQAHLTWEETKRPWIIIIAITIMLVGVNYFLSGGAIVQGVDLTHQHILFVLPFIGFKAQAPFIGGSPLMFSVESITFLLTQAMRNISIALLALPIPYTTDPALFGVAFKGMGVSDKISYAIDLSLRFLPTTVRDFNTTLDAQRARGFEIDKLRGGIFGKIVKLAPMIVPVVIGSIIGAEDIVSAMELRCFGVGKRTWLIHIKARLIDRRIIILAFCALGILTACNILGYIYGSGLVHFMHEQGIPAFLLR